MLADTSVKTKDLPAATRALASTSWLDRKIVDSSKGLIKLGCIACAEFYTGKDSSTAWAHYQIHIPAARTRPARLAPHARTSLHRIAVANLLQLASGPQIRKLYVG